MDYMFPSRNYENSLLTSDKLIIHGNLNLSQEEDPPLFLPFPSPFLDDMDTTTLLPNLHHDNQSTDGYRTTTGTTTANNPLKLTKTTVKPLASKLKCVRKKRTAGKKDRHSKIHTAQGLRDRRMRLSVHTARKFFDLNDMLGFDKASKTIEWLFNKSKKAIDEVAETFQTDDAATQTVSRDDNEIGSPFSPCETESVMEISATAEKDENLELQIDQTEAESSRKQMGSSPLVIEISGKARASEVERTRERMMNKHKQIFEADPIVNFHQSQLGFSEHEEHHNMEESSCYPPEFSNTYQFLKQLHLDNTVRNTDAYLGNISAISSTNRSIFDYNKSIAEPPPAGWLNSKNTFLGFLGGWDSANSSNGGIVPDIAPLNGGMSRENTSSGIISILKSKDTNHASLDHYQ